MRSVPLIFLLSLTILALVLLLPVHSGPLPTPVSRRPFSSSQHTRHLLSRNDSRHDVEESIEDSNEQQARDMQQRYEQDKQHQQRRQQQQQEIAESERQKRHTPHSTAHDADDVDRDAVVTGDDLRHSRDPKQQQKQQQQVISNGTTTPPPSEQTDNRRDKEADRADQAEELARSAEQQRQQEGKQLVDSDEVSNGTNMTAQNNGSAPLGENHPYDHNTQKSGIYNRTSSSSHHMRGHHTHNGSDVVGPYNGTDGRLDQASPYHNTDPQARTWSQQRRAPPNTPDGFSAPPPPNGTYPSPSNPPPFDPSHPSSQQQQPPIASHNSTGHDNPHGYPQPVPSVDHAQRLVDEGAAASGSDVLESSSGSDADDEFDSQATQSSDSRAVPEQQEEEEAVLSEDGSTAATDDADEPAQEPGNNVQWNVLSEQPDHSIANDNKQSTDAAEDTRDQDNGGTRLRNEPRASKLSHSNADERNVQPADDERLDDSELQPSNEQSAVDMVDVERAVSGGSVTGWVVLLLVLCAVAFGVGWWLRRAWQQQKYEPVEQYDAYGDILDEEGNESEYEPQHVQVRVY